MLENGIHSGSIFNAPVAAIELWAVKSERVIIDPEVGAEQGAILEHAAMGEDIKVGFRILENVLGVAQRHIGIEVEIAGIALIGEVGKSTAKRAHTLIKGETVKGRPGVVIL